MSEDREPVTEDIKTAEAITAEVSIRNGKGQLFGDYLFGAIADALTATRTAGAEAKREDWEAVKKQGIDHAADLLKLLEEQQKCEELEAAARKVINTPVMISAESGVPGKREYQVNDEWIKARDALAALVKGVKE